LGWPKPALQQLRNREPIDQSTVPFRLERLSIRIISNALYCLTLEQIKIVEEATDEQGRGVHAALPFERRVASSFSGRAWSSRVEVA